MSFDGHVELGRIDAASSLVACEYPSDDDCRPKRKQHEQDLRTSFQIRRTEPYRTYPRQATSKKAFQLHEGIEARHMEIFYSPAAVCRHVYLAVGGNNVRAFMGIGLSRG